MEVHIYLEQDVTQHAKEVEHVRLKRIEMNTKFSDKIKITDQLVIETHFWGNKWSYSNKELKLGPRVSRVIDSLPIESS